MSVDERNPPADRPEVRTAPDALQSPEALARALSVLRQDCGLSVRDLGRAAGIPVSTVGGYLTGRHTPPATRPEIFARLLGALGVPDGDLPAWQQALWRAQPRRAAIVHEGRAPFMGLAAFDSSDSDLFFGREEESDRLLAAVTSGDHGVVAVVGSSGSGKSSLIRAGLLARLPEDWRREVALPGADPVEAFESAIAALESGLVGPHASRVLVVDQLEELWTLSPGEAERERALDLLLAHAARPGRHLVLGLRSDFYGVASAEESMLPVLRDHQFLVGPPSSAALARTVSGPADVFRLPVDPGLVERIVSDAREGTRDRAAALPHLSHTLSMMWERSPGVGLRAEDYLAVGGVRGAVARSAQAAYDALPVRLRTVARALLLRLVVVEEGAPPTNGVLDLTDLASEDQREVVDHFVKHRILVVDDATVRFSHEAVIDAWDELAGWIAADRARLQIGRLVSREARAWEVAGQDPALLLRGGRLENAVEYAGDDRSVVTGSERAFLTESRSASEGAAAREARTHRRTRRLLVGSTALAAATLLTAGALVSSRATISTERDEARSRQIASEALRLVTKDEAVSHQLAVAAFRASPTTQGRSSLLWAAAEPPISVLRGPVGATMVATSARRQLLAIAGDSPTARLLDTSGRVPRLLATVDAPVAPGGTSIFAVAFSPDGSTLALAGMAGRVRLVDVTDPAKPRRLGADLVVPPTTDGSSNDTVYAMAFSPDGTRLHVGSASSGVMRWKLAGPGSTAQPTPLPSLPAPGGVTAVTVLADGRVVAGTATGDVFAFAPDGGPPVATVNLGADAAAWIDAHGTDVAVALRSTKRVDLLSLTTSGWSRPRTLVTLESWANWVAWSPSGDSLAVGGSDRSIQVLVPSGEARTRFRVPEAVTSLAWDGPQRIVVGEVSGTATVRGIPLTAANSPDRPLFSGTWSADGRRVASFPSGGTALGVRLWDTSTPMDPQPLAVLRADLSVGKGAGSGDISPDGRLVVAGTSEGGIVGWDVSDPAKPVLAFQTQVVTPPSAGGANWIENLRFVDDGTILLGGDDDLAHLVSLRDRAHPRVTTSFRGSSDDVMITDISPDGRLVATGSVDGSTRIYRAATGGDPIATIAGQGYVYAVQFFPDSKRLAVSGVGRTVRIFDITNPAAPELSKNLTGANSTVYQLDIAADGSVAAASTDGTALIWEPSETSSTGWVLRAAPSFDRMLYAIEWAPDGRHLFAVGAAAFTRILTRDTTEARTRVCDAVGDPMTEQDWAAIFPDVAWSPPCE